VSSTGRAGMAFSIQMIISSSSFVCPSPDQGSMRMSFLPESNLLQHSGPTARKQAVQGRGASRA
jgi:hypothetical protein